MYFTKPDSTMTGHYDHYWSGDPAFDSASEAFNYELWLETGDMKHLPVKPNETPSRFVLRPWSEWERTALLEFIKRYGGDNELTFQLVVRGSVRRIVNAFAPGEDWTPELVTIQHITCIADGPYKEFAKRAGMVPEIVKHVQQREFSSPRH